MQMDLQSHINLTQISRHRLLNACSSITSAPCNHNKLGASPFQLPLRHLHRVLVPHAIYTRTDDQVLTATIATPPASQPYATRTALRITAEKSLSQTNRTSAPQGLQDELRRAIISPAAAAEREAAIPPANSRSRVRRASSQPLEADTGVMHVRQAPNVPDEATSSGSDSAGDAPEQQESLRKRGTRRTSRISTSTNLQGLEQEGTASLSSARHPPSASEEAASTPDAPDAVQRKRRTPTSKDTASTVSVQATVTTATPSGDGTAKTQMIRQPRRSKSIAVPTAAAGDSIEERHDASQLAVTSESLSSGYPDDPNGRNRGGDASSSSGLRPVRRLKRVVNADVADAVLDSQPQQPSEIKPSAHILQRRSDTVRQSPYDDNDEAPSPPSPRTGPVSVNADVIIPTSSASGTEGRGRAVRRRSSTSTPQPSVVQAAAAPGGDAASTSQTTGYSTVATSSHRSIDGAEALGNPITTLRTRPYDKEPAKGLLSNKDTTTLRREAEEPGAVTLVAPKPDTGGGGGSTAWGLRAPGLAAADGVTREAPQQDPAKVTAYGTGREGEASSVRSGAGGSGGPQDDGVVRFEGGRVGRAEGARARLGGRDTIAIAAAYMASAGGEYEPLPPSQRQQLQGRSLAPKPLAVRTTVLRLPAAASQAVPSPPFSRSVSAPSSPSSAPQTAPTPTTASQPLRAGPVKSTPPTTSPSQHPSQRPSATPGKAGPSFHRTRSNAPTHPSTNTINSTASTTTLATLARSMSPPTYTPASPNRSARSASCRTGGSSGPPYSAWQRPKQHVHLAAAYPDLKSFHVAVKAEAATWHPIVICAALNYAVQLQDEMDRQPHGARHGGGGGGGWGSSSSGGSGVGVGGVLSQREAVAAESRRTLRQVVEQLQTALLPHIPSLESSRYAVNALWVCAKTGCWGPAVRQSDTTASNDYSGNSSDSGSEVIVSDGDVSSDVSGGGGAFAEALLGRVRLNNYALLRHAAGQAHGNLWWSLSQYGSGESGSTTMAGGGGSSAADESTAAEARGVMDVLEASAAFIKAIPVLDPTEYKPQELANIILGAARLGYPADPPLINHLLKHLMAHPGPFKPQAVSNILYGLGELYCTNDAVQSGASPAAAAAASDNDAAEEDEEAGSGSCLGSKRREERYENMPYNRLPEGVAVHVRGLAQLALRIGLQSFNPQELSNMAYGLAQLGLRLPVLSPRITDRRSAQSNSANFPPTSPSQQLQPANHQMYGKQQQPSQEQLPEEPTAAAQAFIVQLADHVRQRLAAEHARPFSPQALSNVTWALSVMLYDVDEFYGVAVEAVVGAGAMDDAKPQEWSIFFFALAYVNHQPPTDILIPLRRGLRTRRSVTPSEYIRACSSLSWTLAVLNLYDPELYGMFQSAVLQYGTRSLNSQALTNCLWGLALLPEGAFLRLGPLVGTLVEAVEPPEELAAVGLVQLWQTHIEIEAAFQSAKDPVVRPASAATLTLTPTAPTRGPPGHRAADSNGVSASTGSLTPKSGRVLQPLRLRRAATGTGSEMKKQQPGMAATDAMAARSNAPPSLSSGAAALGDVGEGVGGVDGGRANSSGGPPGVGLRRLSPALVAAARHEVEQLCDDIAAQPPTRLQQQVYLTLLFIARNANGNASGGNGNAQELEGGEYADEADPLGMEAFVAARSRQLGGLSQHLLQQQRGGQQQQQQRRQQRGLRGVGEGSPWSSATALAGTDVAAAVAASCVVRILRVEQEWRVDVLGLCVDLCVWLSDGRVVVVEVDGPTHYFVNNPNTRVPRATLRNRQLARVYGSKNVVCVPYWDWDGMPSLEAKCSYLKNLLGL